MSGSVLIGTSFIITKKVQHMLSSTLPCSDDLAQGLIDAAERHGSYSTGESYDYLRNVIWWAGMVTSASAALLSLASC